MLTVISEVGKKGNNRYFECMCDCGKHTVVAMSHLRSGHTKSCGCMAKKYLKSRGKDISGQRFGRLVAAEPAEKEKQNKNSVVWKCICDCGKEFYCDAQNLLNGNTRSCGCLHRDNVKELAKSTLHFVDGTCVESLTGRKKGTNNTSGYRGISCVSNGRYKAEITFKGKKYYLGTYKNLEDAVQARLKGEEMYTDFLKEYREREKSG